MEWNTYCTSWLVTGPMRDVVCLPAWAVLNFSMIHRKSSIAPYRSFRSLRAYPTYSTNGTRANSLRLLRDVRTGQRSRLTISSDHVSHQSAFHSDCGGGFLDQCGPSSTYLYVPAWWLAQAHYLVSPNRPVFPTHITQRGQQRTYWVPVLVLVLVLLQLALPPLLILRVFRVTLPLFPLEALRPGIRLFEL